MSELIAINNQPVSCFLDILLKDMTTEKNIIWATDAYEEYGEDFKDKKQLFVKAFTGAKSLIILPRIEKSLEEQAERTKKKAEVFTPSWLCNEMNNYCDEEWFGKKDVFNTENEDHSWTVSETKIEFPEGKTWKEYVTSTRLEITCGEAPFLVSRYDSSNGDLILPPLRRIGILDRKLRVVNENTSTEKGWIKWTQKAYQSTYGYEYQGDNLLIARANLLLTYYDYFKERFNKEPGYKEVQTIAKIIAWNLWQMDGLQDTVPLGKPFVEHEQLSIFDAIEPKCEEKPTLCKIKDWKNKKIITFKECKEMQTMAKKLFDFVIGNPPYQEITKGNNNAQPIYNFFMDESYKLANCSELITPARFLFDAGQTPKSWNKKMLNDPHFKVLKYEAKASNIFENTDIKGGWQ